MNNDKLIKQVKPEFNDGNSWHNEWRRGFLAAQALYAPALADVIRSPLGVVPDSAAGLVSEADVADAEKRRANVSIKNA